MKTEQFVQYNCQTQTDPDEIGGILNMPLRNVEDIEGIEDLMPPLRRSYTPANHQMDRTPDMTDGTWI